MRIGLHTIDFKTCHCILTHWSLIIKYITKDEAKWACDVYNCGTHRQLATPYAPILWVHMGIPKCINNIHNIYSQCCLVLQGFWYSHMYSKKKLNKTECLGLLILSTTFSCQIVVSKFEEKNTYAWFSSYLNYKFAFCMWAMM